MKTRSALPSPSSPGFTTAAVLDRRFTTVDIAASLSAFGVVRDCMPSNAGVEEDDSTGSSLRWFVCRLCGHRWSVAPQKTR
jgi:hypothetical protein